jgi:hypothetical protein
MKKNLFFLLLLPLLFLAKSVLAQSFSSNSYLIQMGNFNMTGGRKTSTTYNLTDTAGQTFQGQFDSTGFVVKAGFQYIHDIGTFSFSISDLDIDFGSLPPNTLSTDQNTLTVSHNGSGGYQVLAYEDHPLRHSLTSTDIPDSTCDDTTCTQVLCRPWTSTSIYGFGFNASGDDVDTSASKFADSTYFCQFADAEIIETPQPVMASSTVGINRQATITYQANIHSLQEAGTYSTFITYLAIPTY